MAGAEHYGVLIVGCLLAAMVVLFVTGLVAMDVVALAGLLVLAFLGFLSPQEALSGFSSPPLITTAAMFILSAAFQETGVADYFARRILAVAGKSERRCIISLMLVTAGVSAFMYNLAAAALMLPVAMQIAQQARIAPSRLLIPMVFSALLGGSLTLIGTQSNVLASAVLESRGLESFHFLEFFPFGAVAVLLAIGYFQLYGKRILPKNALMERNSEGLTALYRLHERLFTLHVPERSRLDARTLKDIRLGSQLGLRVVGVVRDNRKRLLPGAEERVYGGDQLLVEGRISVVDDLRFLEGMKVAALSPEIIRELSVKLLTYEFVPPPEYDAAVYRERLQRFIADHHLRFVAVLRDRHSLDVSLEDLILAPRDRVFLWRQANEGSLPPNEGLRQVLDPELIEQNTGVLSDFEGGVASKLDVGRLEHILHGAVLSGVDGDRLCDVQQKRTGVLVFRDRRRLDLMSELAELRLVNERAQPQSLEGEDVAFVEAIIPPRSSLIGRTIREVGFRVHFGFQILAIWRDGEPRRTRLANIPLKLGDALLLQGPRRRIPVLSRNQDLVTLTERAESRRRLGKSWFALLALGTLVALTATNLQPVELASLLGALLVLLAGAVTPDEAQRSVDWRTVIFIGAMIPFGIAVERVGLAQILSEWTLGFVQPLGVPAMLVSVLLLASLVSQALDSTVAVVLLGPVILRSAADAGYAPRPFVMALALGVSLAFLTPFSHRANLLITSAGGYETKDFFKSGLPLTILLIGAYAGLLVLIYR